MSGRLATIDPAEIEKFKQRFAAGRAKQIEDANTEATRLQAAAVLLQEQVTALEKTATIARKNWKDKEGLRLRKAKPGNPSDPELLLKTQSETADSKLATAREALAQAETDRDKALKLADKLPREAYTEKFKALNARLKDTGVEMATLDATAVAEIKGMLDLRNYDGVDARLLAIENKVLDTVAGRDLPIKHAALTARMATLGTQTVKDPQAIRGLNTTLEGIDPEAPTGTNLGRLEREIEPAVAALEQRIQVVLDLIQPLDGAIKVLERSGTDAAPHRVELGKCVNIAKLKPEDARIRLVDLTKAVKQTQQDRTDQAAAELTYPGELAALEQRIADFPDLSPSHKSRGGALVNKTKGPLKNAKEAAAERNFVAACNLIGVADDEIDTLDEAADAQEEQKALALSAQQALLAKQLKDAAAKKAKDAKDKAEKDAADLALAQLNTAKAALTLASLDLIGKDSDFETWMDKVRALRTASMLTVATAGGAYWLNGRTTVEIEVDVTGVTDTSFKDYFVVHYHPTAVYDQIGSQVHSKPYTGNMTTPKDRRMNNTGHWLFGTVPTLKNIDDHPP